MLKMLKKEVENLYKCFVFPYGFFFLPPIWYGVYSAICYLFKDFGFELEPVAKCILFFSGLAVAYGMMLLASFYFPKGKSDRHNLYIMLAPDEYDFDEYITHDFSDGVKRCAGSSIGQFNVVVPSLIKRYVFSRISANRANYWESNAWKRLHRHLKGALYLSGFVRQRTKGNSDCFVIELRATIGYNDTVNPELNGMLYDQMRKQLPGGRLVVNRSYEIEEFAKLSNEIATTAEFLVAVAHLVSGDIQIAYDMHMDIYRSKKKGLSKELLQDTEHLLKFEANIFASTNVRMPRKDIIRNLQRFVELFPENTETYIAISRCLVLECVSNSDMGEIIKSAQDYLSKVKITKDNRNVVHANRAYLFLLQSKWKDAEEEQRLAYKRMPLSVADSIIDYCNEVIGYDGKDYEKDTALYVKILTMIEVKRDYEGAKKIFDLYKDCIARGHSYYYTKLEAYFNK